jgi:hypothetical protein
MRTLLLFVFWSVGAAAAGAASVTPGAAASGQYRNLFRELLGKTDAEIADLRKEKVIWA